MRRPGSVSEAFRFITGGELQQWFERSGYLVHSLVGIAYLRKPFGNSEKGKVCGIAVGNFAPTKWRRHSCIRNGTHRISRTSGAIFCVLVVIEKHAVALLFPPFRTCNFRSSPFDGTRQRDCRTPHFCETPSRFNPNVDVHATRPASLWPATQAGLLQERLYFKRYARYIRPADSGNRVKINPQFVRMFQVAGANGMGVEFDTAEVDDPCQACCIINHYLFRPSAGWKRQGYSSQPWRTLLGRALLVKCWLLGAVYKSLQNDWSILNSGKSAGRNREIILHKVALGKAHLFREVQFVRMGYTHLAARNRELLACFLFSHRSRLPFTHESILVVPLSRARSAR
jgi:hypothetical protein